MIPLPFDERDMLDPEERVHLHAMCRRIAASVRRRRLALDPNDPTIDNYPEAERQKDDTR